MNLLRHIAAACLALSLIGPSFAAGASGNCGSAFVEAIQIAPGQIKIELDVELSGQFTAPAIHVGAAGYWINLSTREDFGPLSTPGENPSPFFSAGVYSDDWTVTTGGGIVEIGFPLIEAIHFGGICFGLFPRETIAVTDEGEPIALFSGQIALNRKSSDDLAFVVDTTGSMGDDIAAVKAAATDVVNTLAAESADFRVAVVQYNDPSAGVVSGFSSNTGAIIGAINSLGASGGGDTPEHVYGGLAAALGLPWRPDATRTIITMGDAPPKDPEPGTGLTQAQILSLANTLDISVDTSPSTSGRQLSKEVRQGSDTVTISAPLSIGYVPFFMIPIGGSSATSSSFTALAGGTNGTVFPAANAAEVVPALLEAIAGGTNGSEPGTKAIEPLTLTALCRQRRSFLSQPMQVTNPNEEDVDYQWEVIPRWRRWRGWKGWRGWRGSKGFALKGNGTATPGDSTFTIRRVWFGATVEISWEDEEGETQSTNATTTKKKCRK